MSTDDRVIIAGAGPVGLSVALYLAQHEVPVLVLEKTDGPGSASRASTFHPASLEFLAELGVVDEVEALGLRAPTYQLRDREHGVIAEFDLAVLSDDTPYPYRVQLEQSKYCQILADRLAAHDGVDIRYEHPVTGVAIDGERVTVTAGAEDFVGRFVVGADGAHSRVRDDVGIEHEGFTYPERFLVVSISADLRELIPDLASVNYVSDPSEWLVLLETPDHWRVLFPVKPEEDLDVITSDPALQHRLEQVAERAEPYPVLQYSAYEIHQRVADRFREGPVLLAGDAAHLNNPLGGLGMNSGLQDGWSLARRLVEVWGGGGDQLLDEYGELRREVALEVVDRQSRGNKQQLEERDEAARIEHHRQMAAVAADPARARQHLMDATLLAAARTHL